MGLSCAVRQNYWTSTNGIARPLGRARIETNKGNWMTGAATVLLGVTVLLLGGALVGYALRTPGNRAQVEEIRRLRQEGLAVNQEGEG